MSGEGSNPIERLPHRPPFRFVSHVDLLEIGVRGAGRWRVRGDEDFFTGHFPGDPVVPGVLLGEALAQLSGLLSGREGATGRLAQIDVRFRAAVRPPAEIVLESRLVRELGEVVMFEVAARVGPDAVADGRLVLGFGA